MEVLQEVGVDLEAGLDETLWWSGREERVALRLQKHRWVNIHI